MAKETTLEAVRPEVKRLLEVATLPRESLEVLLDWALAIQDTTTCEEMVK